MDVNEELKFLWKFKKKHEGVWVGGRGRRVRGFGFRGGGQDGCERRIEVFVNSKKIFIYFFFGGGGWVGGSLGVQG